MHCWVKRDGFLLDHDRVYRQRALRGQLEKLPILADLDPEPRQKAIDCCKV